MAWRRPRDLEGAWAQVSPLRHRRPALHSARAAGGAGELGRGGATQLRLGNGQALPPPFETMPQRGCGQAFCVVTCVSNGVKRARGREGERPPSGCRSHGIPPACHQ